MRRSILRTAAVIAVCFLLPALLSGQAPKRKIIRAADIPLFQYPVKGQVEDLIKSEAAFRPFAAQMRKDVESVLRDYDFEDAAAKRRLLNLVASLDILDRHDEAARQRLAEIKSLEEKPASKLTSGVLLLALLDARRDVPDRSSPAYRQAVDSHLRRALESMPFDIVENELKALKVRLQMASEAMILGQWGATLNPIVKKTGAVSLSAASGLPYARLMLLEAIPLKDVLNEALESYLSEHSKEQRNIWAERDVVLETNPNYRPANVAVWDSGVDVAIFKDAVVKDASGRPAVLAYDIDARKTTGNLYPLSAEQLRRFPDAARQMKGFSDLQANIESPESSQLRQSLAQLKAEKVRPFVEELQFFSNYSHGTHVAGIVVAGNPYARIVTGRMTFDWKMIPDPCWNRARVDREIAAAMDYVSFFKEYQVRVVNMSWGVSVKMLEDGLEKCGIGKGVEDRKKTAREWFEIGKRGLEEALLSAPEILFVAAAGNSNADATFEEAIPASLKVPNLLTVAAVDQAGGETAFTSYGPTVVVAANGYEVESYIPGGSRLKMSGTSMASPNAANLAAKMLVVNPKLTPPQVIGIIRQTAEKSPDGRRSLIHPKKAVAAST